VQTLTFGTVYVLVFRSWSARTGAPERHRQPDRRLGYGAEVGFLVTTVPFSPSGNRFEIYGREGTLVISGGMVGIAAPASCAGRAATSR
jgi:hypothetical protein